MRWSVALLVVGLVAGAVGSDVRADEPEKPWAAGVPPERREAALALFQEGNALFETSQYAAALATYQRALAAWDHPAIEYNVAVCLIHLDRPVEAYEHLEAAMQFGADPLGPDIHAQAETNRKLLLGQLARLQVSCDTDGAEITLDGASMLTCPGRGERLLAAGRHQLVATGAGYLTTTRALVLVPGETTTEHVALVALADTITYTRRWPRWKPWAVVGAGAAIALIGVPVRMNARTTMTDYEDAFARHCPEGCDPATLPPEVTSLESSARSWDHVAIGLFATGAVTAVAGAALVYLNQPRAAEHLTVGADGEGFTIGVEGRF